MKTTKEKTSDYERFFINKDKWDKLGWQIVSNNAIHEMQYIIDNIIHSLKNIQFENKEIIKSLEESKKINFTELAEDEYNLTIKKLYYKVHYLLESISEEEIINLRRKNILKEILN